MKQDSEQYFSYESDPDVLLMQEFQKGDRASFENLMRKYYKRIFNFIFRLTGNRETAEDLTQEVFLRVYKAASRYSPKSKFQTWIYTIAKNLSFNELRKNKHPMVSLSSSVTSDKGDVMERQIADDNAMNASDELLSAEKAQKVKEAIARLSINQRMVVILYRYDGMTYDQVAKTMGMSISAVKSLLSRARESLRADLSKFVKKDI